MRLRKYAVAAVLATLAGVAAADEPDDPIDPWSPIHVLLGRWEGAGTSFGTATTVSHIYEVVLQDQFVQMRTRSVSEPEEGGGSGEGAELEEGAEPGEVHEDLGLFSHDPDREEILLRQFLTEGIVNTYVLDVGDGGRRLTFTTESTEGAGGMRARLLYDVRSRDEYELVLELAEPGKDWFACQSMVMKRAE